MIPYTKFQYLYPPRPESAISVSRLDEFDKSGDWIAQVKKNGTCSVIFVDPSRNVTAMTRHKDNHKAWKFTENSERIFKQIPGNGWYVFVAELMHSKGNGIRDTNYIHDVLVANNQYLLGSKYLDRYKELLLLFKPGNKVSTHSHYILNDNTWLAKVDHTNFQKRFMSLDNPEDEGLVLKKIDGKLEIGGKEKNNCSWLLKCRKKHANFAR